MANVCTPEKFDATIGPNPTWEEEIWEEIWEELHLRK